MKNCIFFTILLLCSFTIFSEENLSNNENISPSSSSVPTIPLALPFFRTNQAASTWLTDPPLKHHSEDIIKTIDIPSENAIFQKFFTMYSAESGKKYLQTVMKRSIPYYSYISERIRYYNVPQEILYLPVIESAFLTFDISKSGASGLWQFMVNSIDGYDMKIDEWRDDRRDFTKSTDAAIRKLITNYQALGSWELALAAYNCGLGKVTRVIQKSGIHDYWELCSKGLLPSETVYYVPKFLAVASILMNAGRNNIDLGWEMSPEWTTISIDKPIDIIMLSERANIPKEILKTGNPELKFTITPPGSYSLKVPVQYSENIKNILEDKKLSLLRFNLYIIKPGDTLSALSVYYGVSVNMILQYNPTLKPNALKLGAKIVIPAIKDVAPYAGAPKKEVPIDTRIYGATYIVQKGDSLWSISTKYNTSPENLASANGIKIDTILHDGMSLKVPIKM